MQEYARSMGCPGPLGAWYLGDAMAMEAGQELDAMGAGWCSVWLGAWVHRSHLGSWSQ